MEADNPRAVMGANQQSPDYAANMQKELEGNYQALSDAASRHLETARALPAMVDSDETMALFAPIVKDLRDTAKRADSIRTAEKEPHLRRGQAVDQFFKGIEDRLNKAVVILEARVNDYQQQKLAAERRRREEEARAAAQAAAEARARAEAEEAARRAAALAADRARTQENMAKRQEEMQAAAKGAEEAREEARRREQEAEDARVETLRKSSDLVRTRLDDGALVTMRQVPHVAIEDRYKLDYALLAPFLKEDHILSALKAWAKTTSHRTPMAGAIIEMRDATVIR
jgi:hypothetical protein